MSKSKMVTAVLLLLGGFALYLSFNSLNDRIKFKHRAVSTYGEVIAFEEREGNDTTTYAPVIEFTTRDGETIVHASKTSSSHPDLSVGDQVKMLYDPMVPDNACTNGFFGLWGAPLFSGILGLFWIGVTGLLVKLSKDVEETESRKGVDWDDVDWDDWVAENGRNINWDALAAKHKNDKGWNNWMARHRKRSKKSAYFKR